MTATMPGLWGVWTLVEAAVECGMSSFERIYTKFLMTPNILDINKWPVLRRAERAFLGWSRDTRGEGGSQDWLLLQTVIAPPLLVHIVQN